MKTKSWLWCFGAIFSGWVMLTNNRELIVNEYKTYVPRLPQGFEGMRIALIADLHKKRFGEGYKILVDKVRAVDPDIIVFAGDLYSRDEKRLGRKLDLMRSLTEIAPTYYGTGNHELEDPELYNSFSVRMQRAGVHVLRNTRETIERGGSRAAIYGIELPEKYYCNDDGTYCHLPELTPEAVRELLGEKAPGCTFLIAHDPLCFKGYAGWGADLTMSGHVHGGVVRLPLLGGLLSPERRFFPKYSKGIYTLGHSVMGVTTGLGKFRFHNPTEIMVMTLTSRPQEKPLPGKEWAL